MLDGAAHIAHCVAVASATPITGLYRFENYWQEIQDYYKLINADAVGVSTGWPALDLCYKVVPGELCVVTGGCPLDGGSRGDKCSCAKASERGCF